MYTNILLPTDGSKLSERAIEAGVRLAKLLNARVTGLAVVLPSHAPQGVGVSILGTHTLEDAAEEFLSVITREAEAQGVPCNCFYVSGDSKQEEIIAAAETRGCDLIVMGSKGRSAVGKLLLGSVTAQVIADSKIPVLVIR